MTAIKMTGFFSKTNARIGARFRVAGKDIERGMLEVEARQIQALREKAKRLSGHTAYKLGSQRPNYPYGHNAKGAPPTKLWEANIQKGNLHRGWRTTSSYRPTGATFTLYNTSDESRFFTGIPTSKMQARPLLQAIIGDDLDKMVKEGRRYYDEYVERYLRF